MRNGNGDGGTDGAAGGGGAVVSAGVEAAIVASVAELDTGRQEVLVEYGRRLGPDPALADLDDAAVERALQGGEPGAGWKGRAQQILVLRQRLQQAEKQVRGLQEAQGGERAARRGEEWRRD